MQFDVRTSPLHCFNSAIEVIRMNGFDIQSNLFLEASSMFLYDKQRASGCSVISNVFDVLLDIGFYMGLFSDSSVNP